PNPSEIATVVKAAPAVDKRELRALSRKYGAPQHAELRLDQWPLPGAARGARRGEVVFAIRNPRGRILLHTKSFYPDGIYRQPGACRSYPMIGASGESFARSHTNWSPTRSTTASRGAGSMVWLGLTSLGCC